MTIKFYKLDNAKMKEKVLEVDNTSNAKSNMLLIYQIFAKLISDVYCLDYSDVENFKLSSMKDDNIHFETTGELFDKIKLLKEVGTSSFGVVIPFLANKSDSDLFNLDALHDDVFALSKYDPRTFNKNLIETLISGFPSMQNNSSYSQTKEKSIAELLTAIMFDQSASAYYEKERVDLAGDFADASGSTSWAVKKKIQNYLLAETGLKFPDINILREELSGEYVINDPQSADKSWLQQKLSRIDNSGNFKNNSLGNLGNNLIVKKELKTTSLSSIDRYVLPLETKNVSSYNEKYLAGPDYYLSEIFSNIGIKESFNSDFKETAKNISNDFISFSQEVIKKTGIDFTKNINESSNISIFSNGEYSPYHMFEKICKNIADGLIELKESIKSGEKKTKFQSSLVLYLLIMSGENTDVAESFAIQQFWSLESRRLKFETGMILQNDNADADYKHEPAGNSFLLANACKIGKLIIQEQLGQTTSPKSGAWEFIFGSAADRDKIIAPSKLSPNTVTVGKNSINDNSGTIVKSFCNESGSTNNVWFMSLAGFCNSDSMKKNNDGYQNPTFEDTGVTGLKYSHTSAFKGPMDALGQKELSNIFLYNQSDENFYKLDQEVYASLGDENQTSKEDVGKSQGPIGFNFAQMYVVFFLFVTHLLNESLGASLSVSLGNNGKEKYEFAFDENQIQAVIDALKNNSSPNLIENENYLNAYKIAKNILDRTKNIIVKKSSNILTRIQGILAIANDIVEISKSYERYFDIDNTQDPKIKTLIDFMKKHIPQESINSMFNYMNQDAIEIYSKSIDNFMASSKSNPAFAPSNNITDTQVKLMTLALSKKGHGYYSSEKNGKKTILNIGLPTGLVDYLRKKAYVNSAGLNSSGQPDPEYLNSNYLCIQIFKNSLSPETVTYYPKVFIFDIKRFSIENNSKIKVNQIDNYEASWQYENLRNNFTFISYDNDYNIKKKTGKEIIDEANDKEIMTQLVDNHILDHYLKLYQQSTLGIDVNEYAFPVKPIINEISINDGRDEGTEELFNIFENFIVQNYPSANLDPDLNFEFDRIRAQVSDSLFFKSQNKAKLLMSPKCFDRVFSLMINEEDFVVDSDQLSDDIKKIDYLPFPRFSFDNRIAITQEVNIRDKNPSVLTAGIASKHVEIEAHKKNAKGGDVPTIQQYFCNISLLKTF